MQNFAGRNRFLYTLENRFCRFDKWEPTKKKWNPKERKFVILVKETKKVINEKTKKEIEVEEEVEKPVPLLSEEEAKLRYKADRHDMGYPTDKDCEYFENFYRPAFIYRALNKLVQGSAADMTKKAMVLLYKKGILPHIQIHDELCISIKDHKQANHIKEIMEGAIKLEIDNKVDYESGPNWGNIK